MGGKDNIYDRIQELLGEFPRNLTILEHTVDSVVQSEYNRIAEALKVDFDPEEVLRVRDNLFIQNLPVETKKKLLIQLAAIDRVEAFRTLEKYKDAPDLGLGEWAILALQENRLLLESKLLEENYILISTGLGGKNMKIRYFTVLITRTGRSYTGFEQKLLESEVRYSLKKCDGETEAILFDLELCMLISVIPLKVPIHELFDKIIEECNNYDDFLNPDYMITNVKILSAGQIRKMFRQNRIQKNPEK